MRKAGLPRVIIAICAAWVWGAAAAWALPDCQLPAEYAPQRPGRDAGPTPVHVYLYVIDVIEVDNVEQSFTVDYAVAARWRDVTLGATASNAGTTPCNVPIARVWRPDFVPLNARATSPQLPLTVEVSEDGTVEARQRGVGTYASKLDLSDFPRDVQRLRVDLISFEHGPEELDFVVEGVGQAEDFSAPGWALSVGEVGAGEYRMQLAGEGGGRDASLARFGFEIVAERQVAYYVWKVFLPLVVIVMTSWFVFWVDPSQLAVQSGIGTATLLTIIAFLFSLQNILPRVDYLTRLDVFVYQALFLVFLALTEGMTTSTLFANGRPDVARHVDRWSRILFPLLFAFAIARLWWL
jgi:hypothetical protein